MKKFFTFAAFALIVFAAVSPSHAQMEWLLDETQVIVPGGTGDEFDEDDVIAFYVFNRHRDYQGPEVPHFLISDKKANAVFTIGGFVNFRTAYDFTYVMPNRDFVTAVIPMQGSISNKHRALMDASTSRLFFESVIKTRSGHPLKAYVETDFRGPSNTLRLRQAYVSFCGFKFGQATSTFTDINSAFNTIDFEGPNAYTYSRNLMIQYTHEWCSGLSAGIALEYPVVNATYSANNSPVYQRVPDIPAYLQYAWGGGETSSHIRLSGLLRNMYYTDNVIDANVDKIGWAAQISGSFGISNVARLYGQFLYGKGVTPYVQDLQGLPYDMVTDGATPGGMLALPVMAWFLGAEFHITDKMPLTLGYSQVRVENRDSYLPAEDYKLCQYIVANCFYNFGSALNIGVEYLYGTRYNVAGKYGRCSFRIK